MRTHAEQQRRRRVGARDTPVGFQHLCRRERMAGVREAGIATTRRSTNGASASTQASTKITRSRPARSSACSTCNWKSTSTSTPGTSAASSRSASSGPNGVVARGSGCRRRRPAWARPSSAHLASTTVPSASSSCTESGILPTACVAQERQGSKARTATSMWLSRPSVSCATVEVTARDLADRHVHRLVVVRRRDDEVRAHHLVLLVDAVVVDQRAARRFDHADAARLPLAALPSARCPAGRGRAAGR